MNRIQLITFAALALTAGGCAHRNPRRTARRLRRRRSRSRRWSTSPLSQLAAVDVPELRWKYTPEEIATECAQAETTATGELAKLVAQPDAQRTFASSFDAFEQIMTDYTDRVTRLSFLKEVHPDAKVRAAAANCEERSGKFFVEVGARKDLYLAMKGYQANQEKTEPLAPIDRRLIEITMRDFRRNGLALSDADRAKLVEIRSQIAKLRTEYSANLDNDTSSIEATAAELAGLPASYLARLKKAPDGKYIVTTKYPDYYPLMENARAEELRKREYLAFNSRQTEKNLPLLTQAVALRADAAKLLGYANHADFVTETRMAKNSAEVISFLKKLGTELSRAPPRSTRGCSRSSAKRPTTATRSCRCGIGVITCAKFASRISSSTTKRFAPISPRQGAGGNVSGLFDDPRRELQSGRESERVGRRGSALRGSRSHAGRRRKAARQVLCRSVSAAGKIWPRGEHADRNLARGEERLSDSALGAGGEFQSAGERQAGAPVGR